MLTMAGELFDRGVSWLEFYTIFFSPQGEIKKRGNVDVPTYLALFDLLSILIEREEKVEVSLPAPVYASLRKTAFVQQTPLIDLKLLLLAAVP